MASELAVTATNSHRLLKTLFIQRQPRLSFWCCLGLLTWCIRSALLWRLSQSSYYWPNGDDMKFYHDWALRILQGQWTDGHAFYGLPGYPFCLAGIYALVGIQPIAVGFLQGALEGLTTVFIGLLGSRLFGDSKSGIAGAGIGVLACLGWIAFVPAQAFSIILMPTAWVVAAFWGLVLWITSLDERTTWRTWLLMGLLIGIVSLMVATILMLLPLVVAAIWLRVGSGMAGWRRRLLALLSSVTLVFTGIFAGLAPAWFHNYFVARDPVLLSAHSGLNLWLGNNPQATGYPDVIPDSLRTHQKGLLKDSITVARRDAGRELSYGEVSKYWSVRANTWISENRGAWFALLWRKFFKFWNAFQYDDLSIVTPLQNCGVLPVGLRFGLVAALALPGLVFGLLWRPGSRWIAAAIALHLAALLPVFVTERYRLCAVPGLLLFASFGLWQCWEWLTRSRWIESLGYLGATGLAVLFVSLPPGDGSLLAINHYNAGLRARVVGDFPTAQRELEAAAAYLPDSFKVTFALGNLWQDRNDLAKAREFYTRTIELNPEHAETWNILGAMAALEGNWPEASRCLEKKHQLDPQDVNACYLLARVRMELKDRPGAMSLIREAIRLQPGHPEYEATLKELEK